MLTFKAEVLKSKQKSDVTYNVKIRMTYNREVKRLSTNIFGFFRSFVGWPFSNIKLSTSSFSFKRLKINSFVI